VNASEYAFYMGGATSASVVGVALTDNDGSGSSAPSGGGEAGAKVVNPFATIVMGVPSSILRVMLARGTNTLIGIPALAGAIAMLLVGIPLFSVVDHLNGDVVMPSALLGGCIGRLVCASIRATGFDYDWMDSGLFALFGAASVLGGMTRLTFSLSFLLVDFAGDVRHVLYVLLVISTARAVADRLTPDRLDHVILKYRGFALLDFAQKIEKYDHLTLHSFQKPNLQLLPHELSVAQLAKLLRYCSHNSFPVVGPDGRFLGLLSRRTISLLLWGFSRNIPQPLRAPIQGHPALRLPGAAGNGNGSGGTDTTGITTGSHRVGGGVEVNGSVYSFMAIANPSTAPGAAAAPSMRALDSTVLSSAHIDQSVRFLRPGQMDEREHFASLAPAAPRASGLGGVTPAPASGGYNLTLYAQAAVRTDVALQNEAAAVEAAFDEYLRMRDLDDWLAAYFPEEPTVQRPADALETRTLMREVREFPKALLEAKVDLSRYADQATFTVRASMCLSRTYNLFTVLGVRHLVILDYDNRPTGIITREDLNRENITTLHRHFDKRAKYLAQQQDEQTDNGPRPGAASRSPSTGGSEPGSVSIGMDFGAGAPGSTNAAGAVSGASSGIVPARPQQQAAASMRAINHSSVVLIDTAVAPESAGSPPLTSPLTTAEAAAAAALVSSGVILQGGAAPVEPRRRANTVLTVAATHTQTSFGGTITTPASTASQLVRGLTGAPTGASGVALAPPAAIPIAVGARGSTRRDASAVGAVAEQQPQTQQQPVVHLDAHDGEVQSGGGSSSAVPSVTPSPARTGVALGPAFPASVPSQSGPAPVQAPAPAAPTPAAPAATAVAAAAPPVPPVVQQLSQVPAPTAGRSHPVLAQIRTAQDDGAEGDVRDDDSVASSTPSQ
jgi:hypothetical protein